MAKPLHGFSPRRVLVIQLRQIGDVLLATPAARALKRRFPQASVDFLAEKVPARVLEGNPHLDTVIVRDPARGLGESVRVIRKVRDRRYDLVVDFMANPRSTLIAVLSGAPVTVSYAGGRRSCFYTHAVERRGVFSAEHKLSLLRVLGIEGEDPTPEMAVAEAALSRIGSWLRENGLEKRGADRPLVCLDAFQKWPVLEYPARHHAELARMMTEKWRARVIVCWGPGRGEDARRLAEAVPSAVLAPPTDLHELAAIYRNADLWVGADGGARHLAASQGLPTFAVFGPTDHAWTPPGPLHQSVAMDDMPCRPCNRRRCPEQHHDCMELFEPSRVFSMLDEWKRRVLGGAG